MFKVFKITVLILVCFSASALAGERKTGISGLVIKKFECVVSAYKGNLVNRSQKNISGTLHFYSYDKDGDPIGQCKEKFNLNSKSGTGLFVIGCNCGDATRVEIVVK